MRVLISLFFAVSFLSLNAQEISSLRKEFMEAPSSKANADKFMKSTDKLSSGTKPVFMAYRGAALIIQSKFLPKVEDKKATVKEGVTILEGAVLKDPTNIEIRAIRMSIQENLPKIVKYKKNMPEDKEYILKNYSGISSAPLKAFVKGYIQNSGSFSAEDKKGL